MFWYVQLFCITIGRPKKAETGFFTIPTQVAAVHFVATSSYAGYHFSQYSKVRKAIRRSRRR